MAGVGNGTAGGANSAGGPRRGSAVGQGVLLSSRPNAPGFLPSLAPRLRTGCVYEPHPASTFGVLVTRAQPRRGRGIQADIGAWWPHLAPSLALVTAHHPVGTPLGWEVFRAHYWAELQATTRTTYLRAVVQLGLWLRQYPTVTLLSFEHAPWGEERLAQTQRRILYAWLLGCAAPTDLVAAFVT